MKRTRTFPLITSLAGLLLGLVTVAFTVAPGAPAAAESAPTLTPRAIIPLVAAGKTGPAPAPASTATATRTNTPAPSSTASPTLTPTPTNTPQGTSAYALVTSWYDYIANTLYGRYTAILNRQSAGLITVAQAGAQLTAEKAVPAAYETFLKGQGPALVNASTSCNQARSYLALSAGWLGLMEGWGGLILTYGSNSSYVASREQASNSYFDLMSRSLGFLATCTGSASGAGSPPPAPTVTQPPAATATPYSQPTATPTTAGGGLSCYGSRTTANWQIQVSSSFGSDLFEIVVKPLTSAAVTATFKVRVYNPNYASDDSSTKYPYSIGQIIRLYYGYDFYRSAPYPHGSYEVELRVNFLREASVYVTC